MKKLIVGMMLVMFSVCAWAGDGFVLDLKKSGKVVALEQECDIIEAVRDGYVGKGYLQSPKGTRIDTCWAYSADPEVVDVPSIIVYADGRVLAFASKLFKPFNSKDM